MSFLNNNKVYTLTPFNLWSSSSSHQIENGSLELPSYTIFDVFVRTSKNKDDEDLKQNIQKGKEEKENQEIKIEGKE